MKSAREHVNEILQRNSLSLRISQKTEGDMTHIISPVGVELYASLYERDIHLWLSGFEAGKDKRPDIMGEEHLQDGIGRAREVAGEPSAPSDDVVEQIDATFRVQADAIRELSTRLDAVERTLDATTDRWAGARLNPTGGP